MMYIIIYKNKWTNIPDYLSLLNYLDSLKDIYYISNILNIIISAGFYLNGTFENPLIIVEIKRSKELFEYYSHANFLEPSLFTQELKQMKIFIRNKTLLEILK